MAYDYGMKRNIVRKLVGEGFKVSVVPAETSASQVREMKPDGLFLSNGPGDPAAVKYALGTIRDLGGAGLPTSASSSDTATSAAKPSSIASR